MSADIYNFEQYAGSARGLMSRPRMPSDIDALLEHILSIDYEVYNITDGGAPVTGTLDVAVVMFAAPVAWRVDRVGHTFLWQAPGTLWPLPNKLYRAIVTFNQKPVYGGLSFFEAWGITTKSKTA